MDTLFEVVMYPLQRIVALIFSLVVDDGVTIGSLLVSALILVVIFRALIGYRFGGLGNAGRRDTGTRDGSSGSSGD